MNSSATSVMALRRNAAIDTQRAIEGVEGGDRSGILASPRGGITLGELAESRRLGRLSRPSAELR